MSIEYREQGPALLNAGVRYFNAPGVHEAFAKMAHISNAAVVPAGASIVHIGGQLGRTEEDTIPEDVVEEYRLVFVNVEKALHAAGVKEGFKAVYKCHMFFAPEKFDGEITERQMVAYGQGIKEFCGENKPTQVGVPVPKILWPGARMEMWVEAVLTK